MCSSMLVVNQFQPQNREPVVFCLFDVREGDLCDEGTEQTRCIVVGCLAVRLVLAPTV